MIKNQVAINVLNYNEFKVCSTTQVKGYVFPPANDGVPSMHQMSYSEIQTINGQSDAFRTGLLRFDKEEEAEVYEALNIYNWENIITNEFIEDAIINSTMDKLQTLIDISNSSVFDRVITILVRLQNSNSVDISNRVINTLKARQIEVQNRKLKSDIIIKPISKPTPANTDEIDALKSQIAEMSELLKGILVTKTDNVGEVKTNLETEAEVKVVKPTKTRTTKTVNKK